MPGTRRRRSSSSSANSILGGSNGGLISIIILVVIIAAAGYYYYTQNQANNSNNSADNSAVATIDPNATASADDNEGVAVAAGEDNPTPVPGVTAQLGSGASSSSDWYELHFTAPVYPDNKANHKGGLDTYLVSLMNKAQHTMDVADYDFDLQDVADAMVAAKGRGVQVRMVTDTDTFTNKDAQIQMAFGKLKKAGITVVQDNRSPIMHNKFTVVDKEYVETGSWNYTDGDTYRLNNNMIIIHNTQLAQNYTTEFEKMFVKKEFGPNKDKGVPFPTLSIGSTKIQNYFAAEDGVEKHIVDTISGAKSSVYFMAFSFTADSIGNAIVDKAKAGLKVGGVFETTGSNTKYSEYGKMKKDGLDVYTDGNPYVMHHKVIIIDDHITIFGSFNFSDNADTQNDENLLIVDDPNIAKAFEQEYGRVLDLAKNPPVKKK